MRSPAMIFLGWEEPIDYSIGNDELWENKALLNLFQHEVIAVRLRESWVYEEIKAGIPVQKIVDEFYAHEYEEWALKYLRELKIEHWEGYEEAPEYA